MHKPSFTAQLLIVNAGLLLAPLAQAGAAQTTINVRWEAIASPIPTLGFWGLAAVALLLAVVGMRLLRNSQHAARFMGVLVACGGLVTAMEAGTALIAPPLGIFDEDCAGGNLDYVPDPTQTLANTCPNAVRIIEYQYPERVRLCGVLVESCPEGTLLEAETGICTLNHYDFSSCET